MGKKNDFKPKQKKEKGRKKGKEGKEKGKKGKGKEGKRERKRERKRGKRKEIGKKKEKDGFWLTQENKQNLFGEKIIFKDSDIKYYNVLYAIVCRTSYFYLVLYPILIQLRNWTRNKC